MSSRRRPNRPSSQPMRAGLYYRVSSEDQVEGFSLDAQQRACRAYCEAQGWTVAKEYRDEGKSARTDDLSKRPAFATMLADAEAGLLDVVIVHKLDRFARNIIVTLTTLERLAYGHVGFVSINENMDYTTPQGRMFLTMLASFAQYFSDNLSVETKKGKAERKAQGLYNGRLPYGASKGEDGVPVPHPITHDGLLLAFTRSAEGATDRQVANALNAAGYRTTGNWGANLFTRDTVTVMLRNRFYLGELPDGQGGWLPGKHDAMLDADLFDRAQQARAINTRTVATTMVNGKGRVVSLTGLAKCGHCGGPMHAYHDAKGQAHVRCYQRSQGRACVQTGVLLERLDAHLTTYLSAFRVPDDYQDQIAALFQQAETGEDADERRRRDLTARLARLANLYEWGDLDTGDYRAKRVEIEQELATLRPASERASNLAQAADYLRDVAQAWTVADGPTRNEIAKALFVRVEVTDDRIATVDVQPELAPFFVVDCHISEDVGRRRALDWDDLTPRRVRLELPLMPTGHTPTVPPHRPHLAPDRRAAVAADAKVLGLREAAAKHGVSHQTVWRISRVAASSSLPDVLATPIVESSSVA